MRRILAFFLLLIVISGTVGAEPALIAKPCSTVPEDMGYCLFDKDGKRVNIVYFPHVFSGQFEELRREMERIRQENLKLRQQFQDNRKAVAGQIAKAQEDTRASLEEAQKKNESAFKEMEEKRIAQQETIEANFRIFTAQMASLGGRNVVSLAVGGVAILGLCLIGLLSYSTRKQSKTIHADLSAFVALIKERIENEDRGKQDPPHPPTGNGRTGNTQPIDTRKVAEAKQKAEAAALVISGEPLSTPSAGDETLIGSENLTPAQDEVPLSEAQERYLASLKPTEAQMKETDESLRSLDDTLSLSKKKIQQEFPVHGGIARSYARDNVQHAGNKENGHRPSAKTVIQGSGMVARIRGILTRRRVASVA